METKGYLDLKAIVILIIVTLLWGINHPAIKISNQGVSPTFASTQRSFIGLICGLIYCPIITFVTYFVCFKLIHQYSVSRLSAFTFLPSMFGVCFGVLFFHEELTDSLIIGLPLVSAGIVLVNCRRRAALLT